MVRPVTPALWSRASSLRSLPSTSMRFGVGLPWSRRADDASMSESDLQTSLIASCLRLMRTKRLAVAS